MAIKILRWILVLPLTAASWYLSLLFGMVLLSWAESFCRPEDVVSGACNAPWMADAEMAIFYFCSALAAILWVLVAAFVAPALRREVGWVAYVCGSLVAGMMAFHMAAWDDLAVSMAAGFATAWWIQRARWSAPQQT